MTKSTNPSAEQRRQVRYDSLDDLQADIDQLMDQGYHTIGNWSFAQILEHLTAAMNASFDGFPFQMPWILRKILKPIMKKRFLSRTLPSGFKIPPKGQPVLLPEENAELETAVENFRQAVDRLRNQIPDQSHPLLEFMNHEEWVALHLRHAELHMSHVLPGN